MVIGSRFVSLAISLITIGYIRLSERRTKPFSQFDREH
jgi:hypothetical protein